MCGRSFESNEEEEVEWKEWLILFGDTEEPE